MKIPASLELGTMDCFGLSDIGRARGINSDQFLVADLTTSLQVYESSLPKYSQTAVPGNIRAQLLIVCDGIGGKAGQRASKMAVEAVLHGVLASPEIVAAAHGDPNCGQPLKTLAAILQRCRADMLSASENHSSRHELGTTATLALIVWPRLYLVHVGDSRCYLFRNRRVQQLTTDHTYAQRMVESGVLPAEQAAKSRWNNVLWNVVGNGATELRPETRTESLRSGDSLLLCTDGLFRTVPERTIRHVLAERRTAQESCQQLIDAARRVGTTDNVTAIVARFLNRRPADAGSDDETLPSELLDRSNGNTGVERNTRVNGNSLDDTHIT